MLTPMILTFVRYCVGRHRACTHVIRCNANESLDEVPAAHEVGVNSSFRRRAGSGMLRAIKLMDPVMPARPHADDDRWIRNWDACDREIESWLDDEQMLAELGRRCTVAMLACHAALDRGDIGLQLLLRRLLAADWLGPAMEPFPVDGS